MGTRSIIAEPYEGGFRGRYCHWDGYPSWMGAQLCALVAEHGIERVRQVLLHEHTEWSTICASTSADEELRGRNYADPVVGFGITYADAPHPDEGWLTQHGEAGTEWTYILGDDAMAVHYADSGKSADAVPYDDPPTVWSKFEETLY